MTARTHDAFAFASLITVATLYPPATINISTLMAGLVGNIVGGLLPDIDQASNKLWGFLPAGNYFGRIFRRFLWEHRTLSHSLVGGYLFYKILEWLLPKLLNPNYINVSVVTACIIIGFLSHLIADSLTKEGIPLFFPLKFNIGFPPISTLRITTGGKIEKYLILPGTAIYLFWFINSHSTELFQLIRSITK
jgi:inner membrane protein